MEQMIGWKASWSGEGHFSIFETFSYAQLTSNTSNSYERKLSSSWTSLSDNLKLYVIDALLTELTLLSIDDSWLQNTVANKSLDPKSLAAHFKLYLVFFLFNIKCSSDWLDGSFRSSRRLAVPAVDWSSIKSLPISRQSFLALLNF